MNYLYHIRLRGHRQDDWSDWFTGLQITRLAAGETLLVGALDQTALHGVLARVRDLNLVLLEVKQIDNEERKRNDDKHISDVHDNDD